MSRLAKLIAKLDAFHGKPPRPPFKDPYRLLLWEQVGYLTSDEDRGAAYALLKEKVGDDPRSIVRASDRTLQLIARRGGAIAVAQRAKRLTQVAERVQTKWGGDLKPVLKLTFEEARRELARYPAIGVPGAERILLLCGAFPVLALDSNALRVLQRLGYGDTETDWARAYRESQTAATRELPRSVAALKPAFLLLKHHGQTVCRRSKPQCRLCCVSTDCPTGRLILNQLN